MPALKQPPTLYDLSLVAAAAYVVNMCKQVESFVSDSLNVFDLTPMVEQLHVKLCNEIGPLLEHIYARLNKDDGIRDRVARLNNGKILYAVVMNRKMMSFTYACKLQFLYELQLMNDHVFWSNQLSKLTMVVDLNLSGLYCKNEMLHAIGANCKSLEKLVISSDLNQGDLVSFSEAGFMELTKCQRLRVVLDDSVSVAFGNISKECMQVFIVSLPHLQEVSCEHMGEVLAGIDAHAMASLALTSFRDIDMEPEFVPVMDKLKHLSHIALSYTSHSHKNPRQTIECLAESNVTASSVYLCNFPFTGTIDILLHHKGENITTLHIVETTGMDFEDVENIGYWCKNVEDVQISTLFLPQEEYNDEVSCGMFEKLKHLKLEYNIEWDLEIVQLFLTDAFQIESICLSCATHALPCGDLFCMLDENPMSELRSLKLYGKTTLPVTHDTVSRVYQQCPKLNHLWFHCPISGDAREYLTQIKGEIVPNNYDLNLIYPVIL